MTVIVGVLGPGIPLGGFRTGQMDVIATGVPKFRLVADFVLLWLLLVLEPSPEPVGNDNNNLFTY